jgi:LysR family transcriptional regulator, glycine cleavage system transcriptional activator
MAHVRTGARSAGAHAWPDKPGRRRLGEPCDVLKFPLLHLDRHNDCATWLDTAEVSCPNLPHGPIMNRARMLIDAAIDGRAVRSLAPR